MEGKKQVRRCVVSLHMLSSMSYSFQNMGTKLASDDCPSIAVPCPSNHLNTHCAPLRAMCLTSCETRGGSGWVVVAVLITAHHHYRNIVPYLKKYGHNPLTGKVPFFL